MPQAHHISVVPDQSEFAELRAAERAESARLGAMAARAVASHATDADDCMCLLAMLGLDAQAGRDVLTD
ncbi:hypothetical protein [Nocardia sp. NPDC051570]|uniref:hypothetical protein n=1 Tax=Nocardia sp. NPDC051570 TaxID=3364324 RepID=UPI0037A320E6